VRRQVSQACESALSMETQSASLIEAGDFRIDVDSHRVTVRGRELHLSCAEFDVLVYLVSHTKHIITSCTRLATKSEDGGVRQTEFLPALLSLRKKLREEVPGAQYVQAEAWLLYEFHPCTR